MSVSDEEDYYVPLVDQRVFSAGIKRKRIPFVPAKSQPATIAGQNTTKQNAGDRYLSIVLKKQSPTMQAADVEGQIEPTPSNLEIFPTLCSVCGQRTCEGDEEVIPHESSIAHQVCLKHSHPPSHLDRKRAGLKYLQDYGWDPDARVGLGAHSQGIRIPVKAKEKKDSAGLGMGCDPEEVAERVKARKYLRVEDKVTKLNAKEVRRMEDEKGKRTERLRRDIYGQDLSQYLGLSG